MKVSYLPSLSAFYYIWETPLKRDANKAFYSSSFFFSSFCLYSSYNFFSSPPYSKLLVIDLIPVFNYPLDSLHDLILDWFDVSKKIKLRIVEVTYFCTF